MTIQEAKSDLATACNYIFEVEKQMDEKSNIRRLGYRARLAVAEFDNAIREQGKDTPEDISKL